MSCGLALKIKTVLKRDSENGDNLCLLLMYPVNSNRHLHSTLFQTPLLRRLNSLYYYYYYYCCYSSIHYCLHYRYPYP